MSTHAAHRDTHPHTHIQGGGGPFTAIPYESKGPVPLNLPIFAGHKGDVLVRARFFWGGRSSFCMLVFYYWVGWSVVASSSLFVFVCDHAYTYMRLIHDSHPIPLFLRRQDTDFNPFHDHVIASGSDDTTIKVRTYLSRHT